MTIPISDVVKTAATAAQRYTAIQDAMRAAAADLAPREPDAPVVRPEGMDENGVYPLPSVNGN